MSAINPDLLLKDLTEAWKRIGELESLNTRIQQLEEALKRSEARYHALISAIPNVTCRLSRNGDFLDYRAAQEFPLLMPVQQFIGKNIFRILPHELACLIMQKVERALQTQTMQEFEYPILLGDKVQFRQARIAGCGEHEVFLIIHDITGHKQLESELSFRTQYDALTTLHNRDYVNQFIQETTSSSPLGIIYCDIDGLKLINDTMGTHNGDLLLIAAADIIKSAVEPGNLVARIGGDEFVIMVSDQPHDEVARICKKIRHAVLCHNIRHLELPLSLSMGISITDELVSNPREVLKQAEDNMYREKLHRIQSVRSAVMQDMMEHVEFKYFMIEGPTVRMQNLVEGLAIAIDLPEHRLADLRLLARFHDIGKTEIPEHILLKKGSLSPEERAIMQQHCEFGHRIAQCVPDLMPIANWILHHQEWWNGEGYPSGLMGEDIPLECRILSIADAYDAMTSNRPYREALTHKEAIAELRKHAGSQFDPVLVDTFIQIFESTIG